MHCHTAPEQDPQTMDTEQTTRIHDLIEKINELWISGHTDELYNYFSNNVVFAAPGLNRYLKGKDLCINSYKEFLAQAEVEDYQTDQVNVDFFQETAIGTYHFTIRYKQGGETFHDEGYEIMGFRKFDNRWLLIWRTQMPVKV